MKLTWADAGGGVGMSDIVERAKEAASIEYAPDISYDDWRGLVRELIAEVERLRSDALSLEADIVLLRQQIIPRDPTEAQAHALKCQNSMNIWNQRYDQAQARIKELEAVLADMSSRAERLFATVTEDGAYRDRLEAAFLSAVEDAGLNPRRAREALERIRNEQI